MQRAVFSGRTNRLFVGIVPDDEARAALVRSLSMLKQEAWARDVRWMPKENIHLTLRFLGDVDKEKYVCLSTALVNHVGKTTGFEISLSKILFLPSASKARVVAVGSTPVLNWTSWRQSWKSPLFHVALNRKKTIQGPYHSWKMQRSGSEAG